VSKILRLLVSTAILGGLAWRTDWGQIAAAFGQLHLGLWLAAVGLYALTQCLSALRWQELARPLGFNRPLRDYAGFYFIGMYFNLMLPTSVGGDVVRAWYLDGRSGRRFAAFFSVLLDRGSGLLVLLSLACVGTVMAPVGLPAWISACVWGTAGCVVLGLSLAPVFLCCGGEFCERLRLRQMCRSIRPLLTVRLVAWAALLSLAVQALNVVLVWMIGQAIEAPVPANYYWIVVPMVSLLTVLPLSLNGMGIREGGMILFLAPVGVGQGTALCLALLWFAAFSTASLAGGLVYLFGSFPWPSGEGFTDGSIGGDSGQGRAGQRAAAA
jgi:uncharacterized membrane protein YbhN (UPF0104 family)